MIKHPFKRAASEAKEDGQPRKARFKSWKWKSKSRERSRSTAARRKPKKAPLDVPEGPKSRKRSCSLPAGYHFPSPESETNVILTKAATLQSNPPRSPQQGFLESRVIAKAQDWARSFWKSARRSSAMAQDSQPSEPAAPKTDHARASNGYMPMRSISAAQARRISQGKISKVATVQALNKPAKSAQGYYGVSHFAGCENQKPSNSELAPPSPDTQKRRSGVPGYLDTSEIAAIPIPEPAKPATSTDGYLSPIACKQLSSDGYISPVQACQMSDRPASPGKEKAKKLKPKKSKSKGLKAMKRELAGQSGC